MPDGVADGLGKDLTRSGLTCTVRDRDGAVEAGVEDEIIGEPKHGNYSDPRPELRPQNDAIGGITLTSS